MLTAVFEGEYDAWNHPEVTWSPVKKPTIKVSSPLPSLKVHCRLRKKKSLKDCGRRNLTEVLLNR